MHFYTTIRAIRHSFTIPLCILIVEDEPAVAVTVQETLQRAGYNTFVVENGKSATTHYEMAWRKIDLVLLDLILPDMTGHQVFTALKTINPAVNVLLTSGFIIDGGVQQILDEGACGFIQKLYQCAELLEKVRSTAFVRT
jgi:DNA-binding response OmpR family regulator